MNITTSYTDEDLANAYTDTYGIVYSADKKRLLKGCFVENYVVLQGTEIICDRAFQSKNIESIILPDSLLAIGVCAFANNERLREIEIPQSVVHFANNNPFGGCKSLNTIKMNSSNFVVDEGLIYSNDYRILYSALFVFNSSSVIFIDNRTEEISANCFWGQKGISTIVVPESVKLIGKAAFDKSDIRYLELKCPIETIPESFMSLSHCDHLSLPNSIKHIGSKAFFMSTFKELVVGEEIESIGEYAFSTLHGLKKLKLNSVVSIEKNAFSSCYDLQTVNIEGNIDTISSSSFSGCKNLLEISLPQSVRNIHDNAISQNEKLECVKINGPLSIVEDGNFWACDNLKEIQVPSEYFFDCYISISKYTKEVASKIFDGKISANKECQLSKLCEKLVDSYVQSSNYTNEERFSIIKPHLIEFSKEIRKVGWFTKTENRNYLVSGTAAMIHVRYLNKENHQKIQNGIICCLNELGLSYYKYENQKVRAEASILMVRLIIEYFPLLDDIITSCLEDLNENITDTDKKVFVAYITEFLFNRSVKNDEVNQCYIPIFEDRQDLMTNHIFAIRYHFINDVISVYPSFFSTENFPNVFEKNYSLFMSKIHKKCVELSLFDYDDIHIEKNFVKKLYFNENQYSIV